MISILVGSPYFADRPMYAMTCLDEVIHINRYTIAVTNYESDRTSTYYYRYCAIGKEDCIRLQISSSEYNFILVSSISQTLNPDTRIRAVTYNFDLGVLLTVACISIEYEAGIINGHSTYIETTSLYFITTYLDHSVRLIDRIEDGGVTGVVLVRQSILLGGEGDVVDVGHLQSYLRSVQA